MKDEICRWNEDQDGEYWETECNHHIVFETATPKENAYKYCPFCSGEIVEIPYEWEDGEGDEGR